MVPDFNFWPDGVLVKYKETRKNETYLPHDGKRKKKGEVK